MKVRRYIGKGKIKRFYLLSLKDRIRIIRKDRERGMDMMGIARKYGVRRRTIARYWGGKLIKKRAKREKGENMEVSVFFKMEEYGSWGHELWVNCSRSCVFEIEEVEENLGMDNWIEKQKDIILEDLLDWFGSWIYESEYEWGVENEYTDGIVGSDDYRYTYSHDGDNWKEWTVG